MSSWVKAASLKGAPCRGAFLGSRRPLCLRKCHQAACQVGDVGGGGAGQSSGQGCGTGILQPGHQIVGVVAGSLVPGAQGALPGKEGRFIGQPRGDAGQEGIQLLQVGGVILGVGLPQPRNAGPQGAKPGILSAHKVQVAAPQQGVEFGLGKEGQGREPQAVGMCLR